MNYLPKEFGRELMSILEGPNSCFTRNHWYSSSTRFGFRVWNEFNSFHYSTVELSLRLYHDASETKS